MRAQLNIGSIRPGKEEGLHTLLGKLRAIEQPGSGLLRSTAMRDQKDPSRFDLLVVSESEESARA